MITTGLMKSGITITKGYGITIKTGYVELATLSDSDCIGVALETKTSGASAHPTISYLVHGIVEVTFHTDPDTDPGPGDSIMISGTAGLFTVDTDTGITTGGLANKIKKGCVLEDKDISVDADVLVFFCP